MSIKDTRGHSGLTKGLHAATKLLDLQLCLTGTNQVLLEFVFSHEMMYLLLLHGLKLIFR